MKTYFLFFICLITFFVSCRHSINYDNIKIRSGLYIDSSNGKILDGRYICVTPSGQAMSKEDVIIVEYSNGIPIGEWTDTYGGDLIHSGKYLGEENTKSSIQQLTKCKRVDLDLWKEGDIPCLTLELIEPTVTDTLTLKKVVEATKNNLSKKYKFKEIRIDSIGKTDKNYIYEYNIE